MCWIPPYVNKHKKTSNRRRRGLSLLWSYGSWIYNYLWNQCLSPLKLWIWIPFSWGELYTTLCDKVCQWLATGRWFSPGIPVSSTNKTNLSDIAEILLKVALNTMTITINPIIETLPINSLVTVKIYSELSINKTYLGRSWSTRRIPPTCHWQTLSHNVVLSFLS
jgi:hypothetical protein